MENVNDYDANAETSFTEQDGLLDVREDHVADEVASFAKQHDLTHKLDVLQEAATAIRNGEDDLPGTQAKSKWRQPLDLYLCITATALGAMIQGWAQTNINGANIDFPRLMHIGALMTGVINCAIYLSNGLLGSWLVAPLNRRFGRRGTAFLGASIALIFNVASSTARIWQTLLGYRLALGVGLGIINSTLNVFSAECSPAAIRGGLGVAWQMFCAFGGYVTIVANNSLGVFLGFLTNMNIENNRAAYGDMGWTFMLLAAAIPCVPLLLLIFFCPESPLWCIKEEREYRRAFEELCRLRTSEREAAGELLQIYFEQNRASTPDVNQHSMLQILSELYTVPRNRRAVLAAYTTQLAQQLCGINIVAFYSSTIFVEANFTRYAAMLASTIFGLVNWLGAFPAIWTMDSLGRRSLLLLTLPFMAITMAIAGSGFSVVDANTRLVLTAGMIYLFCLLYSPGMGPVPAAYSAEVFPSSHREIGASSAIALTNILAAVLSLTFPWLLNILGTTGSFLLYAFLNIVAWILVFLFVPETKQKSLQELDEVFEVPTRAFVKYQVTEYAPWWVKRYLLLRRNEILKHDPIGEARYEALNENEDFD